MEMVKGLEEALLKPTATTSLQLADVDWDIAVTKLLYFLWSENETIKTTIPSILLFKSGAKTTVAVFEKTSIAAVNPIEDKNVQLVLGEQSLSPEEEQVMTIQWLKKQVRMLKGHARHVGLQLNAYLTVLDDNNHIFHNHNQRWGQRFDTRRRPVPHRMPPRWA
jgi:hypothetical protein